MARKKTTTRGGYRPGSGRPAKHGGPTRTISCRAPIADYDTAAANAKSDGLTLAEWLLELVRDANQRRSRRNAQ